MPFLNIPIKKEDFLNCGWEEIVGSSDIKVCDKYFLGFFEKVKWHKNNGYQTAQEIFMILGSITSLYLDLSSEDDPLKPMNILSTGRSAIIYDFSDEQLNTLSEWIPNISDADLKARIADVVWLRKKDYHSAKIAISAYLESGKLLVSSDKWIYAIFRIERALQLSASLGKRNEDFKEVINAIESIVDRIHKDDRSFITHDLMRLLLSQRQGDANKYAEYACQLAEIAEVDRDWCRARTYWDDATRWYKFAGNKEKKKESFLRSSETYFSSSQESLSKDPPRYMEASMHLQYAIQSLRRIGGMEKRIEELKKELLKIQEHTIQEMSHFTGTVDLSEMIDKAQKEVKGKSFLDGLRILSLLFSVPKKSVLREWVIEQSNKYPLRFLFPYTIVNKEGKKTAHRPALLTDDNKDTEKAIHAEMFSQAVIQQRIAVDGIIEPMRHQINLDNPLIRDFDFLQITSNNPFIPPGREMIFARGLYAGMVGDFLISSHLLIPQLENSFRYLLMQNNIITSNLEDDSIQEEYTLNKLLYMPELKEIFGDDLMFDLQGLLNERFGSNLRNLLTHGLVDHDAFELAPNIYAWWLTLRLCIVSLVVVAKLGISENIEPSS